MMDPRIVEAITILGSIVAAIGAAVGAWAGIRKIKGKTPTVSVATCVTRPGHPLEHHPTTLVVEVGFDLCNRSAVDVSVRNVWIELHDAHIMREYIDSLNYLYGDPSPRLHLYKEDQEGITLRLGPYESKHIEAVHRGTTHLYKREGELCWPTDEATNIISACARALFYRKFHIVVELATGKRFRFNAEKLQFT